MILCYIDIDRIRDISPEMKQFKGFKIGDFIIVPEQDIQYFGRIFGFRDLNPNYPFNLAMITGFNRKLGLVYWITPVIKTEYNNQNCSDLFQCKKL